MGAFYFREQLSGNVYKCLCPIYEWYITCPFCLVFGAWELWLWPWWIMRVEWGDCILFLYFLHYLWGCIYFYFGWSTWFVRGLWQWDGFVEKRLLAWIVWRNVIERVIRIAKIDGDVEPHAVSRRVSWTTLLY